MTFGVRLLPELQRTLSAALMLLPVLLPVRSADAAEVLMFVRPGCSWCELWRKEIGPIYPKTPEGRLAPLRELDIGSAPATLKLKSPLVYTPTFVVVSENQEIGRVTGYPGPDFFWSLLSRVLLDVPRDEP